MVAIYKLISAVHFEKPKKLGHLGYNMSVRLFFSLVLCACFSSLVTALYIDGCPMYGCRPSGSFSFYSKVPGASASINWVSNFRYTPVPQPYGCVSNSGHVVCQYNNVFNEDQGYISVNVTDGTIRWQDRVLRHPSLPLLDEYGDVTGSDGTTLVHYGEDGQKFPDIPCSNLTPLLNMALVGDAVQYLLLVSTNGNIVVRQTNGIPLGSLTLNATLDGVPGAFLPVSQPVIYEARFYILTRFHSSSTPASGSNVTFRVYAIDVMTDISDRIKVGWYISVGETKGMSPSDTLTDPQALLFDRGSKLVYVALKSQGELYGILDMGNKANIQFVRKTQVVHMSKFVKDHCGLQKHDRKQELCQDTTDDVPSYLWVVTSPSTIAGVSANGSVVVNYDLQKLLKTSVNISSMLSTTKYENTENDTLIFAITAEQLKQSNITFNARFDDIEVDASIQMTMPRDSADNIVSYVVALDTGKQAGSSEFVRWTVGVPQNLVVRGQITATSVSGQTDDDMLVAYAELPGKSAAILTIH